MKLETKRMIITEFDISMAEDVHKNSLDEDTRRYVPDEVFETISDARETIEYLMSVYQTNNGPLVYPVLLKDGTNIGYVQLVPIDNGYEVGYHIAKEYTGNGYATEALATFLNYIMAYMDIKCVYGICMKENIASIRVLEKCEFVKEMEGIGEYQGITTHIVRYVYTI